MVVGEVLYTAEEYHHLPDIGKPTELVRGKVVVMNVPYPRHGQICVTTVILLNDFLRNHNIGQVVANDSGVVTERDPDTVRGADVAFYSYSRVPKGPLPDEYLPLAPDLVFEVRSSGDRWRRILTKVAEYLNAGVTTVVVLDPSSESAYVYTSDEPQRIFAADQELALPEVLGEFRVVVREFFR